MKDKTRDQLIAENEELRRRVTALEGIESQRRQAEEESAKSKAVLQATIDSLPFDFFALGPDGRYIMQNATSRGRWGDATGKRPEEVCTNKDDLITWLDNNRRAFGGDKVDEEVNLTLRGEKRFYRNVITPIRGKNITYGILGVNIDITEPKRAEEALQKAHDELEEKVKERTAELTKANEELAIFRKFAEASGQGFSMADLDGRLMYLNPTLCRMLGDERPEDRIGQHLSICYSEESNRRGKQEIEPALMRDGYWQGELSMLSRQGKSIPTWQNSFLIRDDSGNPLRLAVVITDITERKAAEEALRESEERFRVTFEEAPVGMAICVDDGVIAKANRALCRMSGYTQEDLIGRHVRDLTHPEDRELSGPSVKRLLAGEIPSFTLEKRYLRKDGQPFWAQATTAAIQGPDGKIAFALGIVEDITERKQAEDALRQSHKELRAIYDGMFDGLLIMDLETKRFARANPSICRMLGYSDEELLSLSLMDIHVPDEIPVIQQRLQDRAEGRFHGHATTQLVRKDGSLLWADVSSNPLTYGGHPCIAGFFRDITERKLAEETLRISEEKYRGVAEACPDAIVMSDLNGRVLFASRQTWGLLGLADSDELVGQSVFDSVIENDRKRLAENMFHLVGVGVRRNTEYPALRKDGTTVPAEVSSSVIRDVEGQPKAVMAVIRDITERKQAQEALRQSEERYELAVRGAGVGIWDWDIRTGKLYFSPRWKMLFGYDENEIGDSLEDWARLLHPDERDWILKFQEDFLAGTSPTVTVEYRLRHKDGSYHWIVAHGLVVRDEQGRACRLVGSHGDITDRKQAEEALERERQTLWHMLQASDHERQTISYDIHDGLAQYLAAAGMQLQVFDGLRESNPEAAKKAYDAATQLVSQSYAEARRLVSEVRPPIIDEIGLETAISHLVHEQRRHGGPEIECHSSVQFGRLPAILENALYRIAQEALTNACKHSKSKVVTVTMTQEGQDVRLEVRDWGIGFDPKSVGKEHFGLEGIRQRVRLLGGRLTIESAQGSGTLVQVVVPVVERENEE